MNTDILLMVFANTSVGTSVSLWRYPYAGQYQKVSMPKVSIRKIWGVQILFFRVGVPIFFYWYFLIRVYPYGGIPMECIPMQVKATCTARYTTPYRGLPDQSERMTVANGA